MVDIAFGPEPGKRPDLSVSNTRYLEMVRRKRMYGGIIMVLFVAFMASGWMLADERNAGGFWDGLHQVFDFPSEVLSEAWTKLANLPGIFVEHVPALIETLNIAAIATLVGGLAAMVLALL